MINLKRGIKVFNGKRALQYELFFNVFEIVLAAIVLISLLAFINDVADKTIFEKNYMSRDLAMLINTLYSSPGEVLYDYRENLITANTLSPDSTSFVFDFSDNKVKVNGKKDPQAESVFYPFAENKDGPVHKNSLAYTNEPITIKFRKTQNAIQQDKAIFPGLDVNRDIAANQP